MQLTIRQKEIVKQLLNSSTPIITQTFADNEHVSVRTIKYDLQRIREWLGSRSSELISRPHAGIWFQVDANEAQRLRQEVDTVAQIDDGYLRPSDRMQLLLLILLQEPGYITIQQLQTRINVSHTTLKNDLRKIGQYLSQFHVSLVNKNYYGFELDGTEENQRALMARVLQDQLNRQGFQSELLSYFNHDIDLTQTLVFTNDLNLNRVFNIVMHFVLKREIIVNDLSQILNMMIRLVITISRLSINHLMNSPQEILISELDKDSVALIIRDSLQYYDLTLSKDDYHYIRVDQGGTLSQHTQNLVEVTNALITGVSQVTGHDYTSDGQLQENLYTHLAQSLNNNPATSAYSPFVKDIKANYPDLFSSLSQICQQQFQAQNDLVTDGFVSYIALHFLVSLQRDLKAQRKVRIVYVCATGLGVTTLIQSRIKATIANVEIAGFASINNAKLVTQQLHPDLVISIFPLPNFETPVIEVQPLPTQEDLTRIKAAVAKQLKTPEEALMLTNNTAESDLDDNALESDTKAIILMMFEITGDLITRLPPIKRQYQDAFRMHVFLAVHRIMFNQQFDANQYHVDTELGHIVQKIFDQHNLKINNSEINALLEYVQLSEK